MAPRTSYLLQEDGFRIILEEGDGFLILDQGRAGFYIQDPRFMSFERWAATVTSDNSLLPVPIQESRWKEWASRIYQITGNTPDPVNYTDWRKWAMDWLAST